MNTKNVEFHIAITVPDYQDVDEIEQVLLDIADDYSLNGATIDVVEE